MKNAKNGGGRMMRKTESGSLEEIKFFETLLAVDFNNHSEEYKFK